MVYIRILSVLRRKSAMWPQVGLLAERWRCWSNGLTCAAGRFAFPECMHPSGFHEAAASITVAGPRRILTGFPVMPNRGT